MFIYVFTWFVHYSTIPGRWLLDCECVMEDAHIDIFVFEFGEKNFLSWVCIDECVNTGKINVAAKLF